MSLPHLMGLGIPWPLFGRVCNGHGTVGPAVGAIFQSFFSCFMGRGGGATAGTPPRRMPPSPLLCVILCFYAACSPIAGYGACAPVGP